MYPEDKIKNIAILGSTGSIGTQALQVIGQNPGLFKAYVLTAQTNSAQLIGQAIQYLPAYVVITDADQYPIVKTALAHLPIQVMAGPAAIAEVVTHPEIDTVLTALVGFAGLEPTIAAIRAGKAIALANKETLVVAGELITDLAKQHSVSILPVDSEHSAIFQCLAGEENNPIEKLIITASGGPFRGKNLDYLANVTRAQAPQLGNGRQNNYRLCIVNE
jgi:1-deoxy-D-xylulose-5-phosphate reductoisomerase